MDKKTEQLVFAYLKEQNTSEELLARCRHEPQLLEELAGSVVTERLMNHLYLGLGSEAFISSVCENIQHEQGDIALSMKESKAMPIAEKPRNFLRYGTIFSGFCVVLLMLFLLLDQPSEIGYYKQLVDVKHHQQAIAEAQSVFEGHIELDSGYAEIELINGVGLILEAPVSITLKSVDRLVLNRGRLVANVPKNAIGFSVLTPTSEIVDLSTSFGVSVNASGDSEVHVLAGEVKAREDGSSRFIHVKENEALAFVNKKQIQTMASQPREFVRTLPGTSVSNPNYLHWTFDEFVGNKLLAVGNGFSGRLYSAEAHSLTSESATLVNGQFGNAMYFDGETTWLKTDFPGIGGNSPRTVAFWVKVPEQFSSTTGYGILSWGLQEVQSAWQISPNPELKDGPLGRIRIGTNTAQVIGTTDLRDNRWHHIAVVLYGGSNVDLSTHVIIYIDGELESSSNKSISRVYTELQHPDSKPLIMGRNLGYHSNEQQIERRFFKGWLDELFIFDAALDQQQVKSLIRRNGL